MFKSISIRTFIFANFVVLILLVSSLLLGLQYYSNNKLAVKAVEKSFKQTSDNIVHFLKTSTRSTKKLINMLASNIVLEEPLNSKNRLRVIHDFIFMMQMSKRARAVYIAQENNDFLEVVNLKNDPVLAQTYHAPLQSIWAVIFITHKENNHCYGEIEFLDKDLNILVKKKMKKVFAPTSRVWYKLAKKENRLVRTDAYQFSSLATYGMTYAKEIDKRGSVLAIDFTLENINELLHKQNFHDESYIVLYEDNSEVLASSRDLNLQKWKLVYKFFQKNYDTKMNSFHGSDREYFTYHLALDGVENHNLNLGILLSKEALLAPYKKEIIEGIYLSLAFLLLSIPFMLFATSLITKPIRLLMLENSKITKRNFHKVSKVQTQITEFQELSGSLVSMSQSIQEYQLAQANLLDSIVKLIADAIDAKSAYTGGHCDRVPRIAEMLTHYVSDKKEGVFHEFSLKTEDEWREFHIGAWLHDCGKVTTPEYVVDKSTKLETIYNRIHEVRTRFEVLYRDAQISYLESQLKGEEKETSLKILHDNQAKLIEDFNFIATANVGGEFMSPEKQERIKEIASQKWIRHFNNRIGLEGDELQRCLNVEEVLTPAVEELLSDKQEHLIQRENFDYEAYKADGFKEEVPEYLYNRGEVYNLCVAKGTLSLEERFKINEHIIMTIKMLEQLPFPKELAKIPEYAGTHHETMIGTGYPRKLRKNELSVPARIMAIADIFEALTASDRPYKKAKTLSESLKIMSFMVKDEHIDADLFKEFLESKIYLTYAQQYLKPEQIDEVEIKNYI